MKRLACVLLILGTLSGGCGAYGQPSTYQAEPQQWKTILEADLDGDGRVMVGRLPDIYEQVRVQSAYGGTLLELKPDFPVRQVLVAGAGAPYPVLLTTQSVGNANDQINAYLYRPNGKRMERLQWLVSIDQETGLIMVGHHLGGKTLYRYSDGKLQPAEP